MKATLLSIVSVLIVILNLRAGYAFECEVDTFSDADLVVRKSTFNPRDRIYVKVSCIHLPVGEYNTHVNWILPNLGIFRSNRQPFVVEYPSDRIVYFWMQLSKNDTFSTLFTNRDYKDEYFGEWVVETYINEVALPRKTIIIH